MGICCVLYAVRDATIEAVLADPPLVWRVIDPDDDAAYFHEIGFGEKRSWLARLLQRDRAVPEVRSLSFSEHELLAVDLDKAWDALNACLGTCRTEWADFLQGGVAIGEIEVGYGPARCHRSAVVSRVADACLSVDESELLKALRLVDMHKRYPRALWNRSDDKAARDLVDHFAQLQHFLRHARDHALGTLIQFT